MSFSNTGIDTFDAGKTFIGVRMQQGVPLLDRDWNEMEDIRRYFERMLRRHYIGDGVPDLAGFVVSAPSFTADDDVMIGAGRCTVDGFDVESDDPVLFSEQGDRVTLPPALADAPDILVLYLEPDVMRVDAATDEDLRNTQDVNMETCVRDRLVWTVRAARDPELPPAGAMVLAVITRPAGAKKITNAMISDRRRVMLNLADAIDRIGRSEDRLAVLEALMQQAQLDIEAMKQQLGRLFWDIKVESTTFESLFGGKVSIAVTVTDRLGSPISGAVVAFSTDWGSLSSTMASTGSNGKASVDLVGVQTETPLRPADVGILQRVGQKVQAATLVNPGAIEYANLRFEPNELSIMSRYSTPGMLVDISNDLPVGPIVARPERRTATVTVHAKDGQGAIVRGVGSVQVNFGLWIRDFIRTKIADVTRTVEVGARIGDILRQGVVNGVYDHVLVADQLLPVTMQSIQDDTTRAIKQQLFADPDVADDDVGVVGMLGQLVAQEATTSIGGRTNQAISRQLQQFVGNPTVPLDDTQGQLAATTIVQKSSQISAGFFQGQRQLFGVTRVGG